MVDAITTDGGGLAGRHRLIKLNAINRAVLLTLRRIGRSLARCLPTKTGRCELGGVTAVTCICFGGCRRRIGVSFIISERKVNADFEAYQRATQQCLPASGRAGTAVGRHRGRGATCGCAPFPDRSEPEQVCERGPSSWEGSLNAWRGAAGAAVAPASEGVFGASFRNTTASEQSWQLPHSLADRMKLAVYRLS